MKNSFPLFIAWLAITTVLLTLPGSALPKEDWLDQIWMDKWVHVGLFFVLVWLGGRSLNASPKPKDHFSRYLSWAAALCLCYGIVMEFIQHYWIANRTFDLTDIAADALGCIAGWLFIRGKYIKK